MKYIFTKMYHKTCWFKGVKTEVHNSFLNISVCDVKFNQWCDHEWMKWYFPLILWVFLQMWRQSWWYSERFFSALWKNRIFSIAEQWEQSIFLSFPRKIVADYIVVIWNENESIINILKGSKRLRLPDFKTVGTWRW